MEVLYETCNVSGSKMGIWEDVGHDPCEEVVVVDRLNKKTE